MFSAVIAWFHNTILGIKHSNDEKGVHYIEISPRFISSLNFAEGSFKSDFGNIYVNWQRKGDAIELTVRTAAKIQPITIEGYSVEVVELDESKGCQKLILMKK